MKPIRSRCSLGLAGRSGRIKEYGWILGLHLHRRDVLSIVQNDVVPPVIAALAHRGVEPETAAVGDDDVQNARGFRSASSSTDFNGAATPRRQVPFAVMTALASP